MMQSQSSFVQPGQNYPNSYTGSFVNGASQGVYGGDLVDYGLQGNYNANQGQQGPMPTINAIQLGPPPSMQALDYQSVPGCPPGLEFLINSNGLYLQPRNVFLQCNMTGINTTNQYDIFDSNGTRLYYAAEVANAFGVQFSSTSTGSSRPFNIQVFDFMGRVVLHAQRQYSTSYGCQNSINCCGQSGTQLTVNLMDYSYLGMVEQQSNGSTPLFYAYDEVGNRLVDVFGPPCSDCCCACPGACGTSANFTVQIPDGQEIGQIMNQSGVFGLTPNIRRSSQNNSSVCINFPINLDVRIKALLLAEIFLINIMFYGNQPQTQNNRYPNPVNPQQPLT